MVKDITEADAIQFSKKNGLYVDNNFPPDSALGTTFVKFPIFFVFTNDFLSI